MLAGYTDYIGGFFFLTTILKAFFNWSVINHLSERRGGKSEVSEKAPKRILFDPTKGREDQDITTIIFFLVLIPWWKKHPPSKRGNAIAWAVFGITALQVLVVGILIYLFNR